MPLSVIVEHQSINSPAKYQSSGLSADWSLRANMPLVVFRDYIVCSLIAIEPWQHYGRKKMINLVCRVKNVFFVFASEFVSINHVRRDSKIRIFRIKIQRGIVLKLF